MGQGTIETPRPYLFQDQSLKEKIKYITYLRVYMFHSMPDWMKLFLEAITHNHYFYPTEGTCISLHRSDKTHFVFVLMELAYRLVEITQIYFVLRGILARKSTFCDVSSALCLQGKSEKHLINILCWQVRKNTL